MKYYLIVLSAVIVLVSGFLAESLLDNDSARNTTITNTQADKKQVQEPKALNQADKRQFVTSTGNSFSVDGADVGEKDNFDDTDPMLGKGKVFLMSQVDNRLKQLSPFKAQIEYMHGLSDAERTSLVSELNAEIEMFVAFKADIKKTKNKQDIKNVAEKIKATWLKSRHSVASAQGQILAAKENQLIIEADTATLAIQKRIDELKATGKDTKSYDKLLFAYNKKIIDAKRDAESAKRKTYAVANASTDVEKERLIKEKELLLQSTQENIRDAYNLITQEIREDFSRRYK
jgi:hypothetical protein